MSDNHDYDESTLPDSQPFPITQAHRYWYTRGWNESQTGHTLHIPIETVRSIEHGERARIVAWLRRPAVHNSDASWRLREADAIERGAHRTEQAAPDLVEYITGMDRETLNRLGGLTER